MSCLEKVETLREELLERLGRLLRRLEGLNSQVPEIIDTEIATESERQLGLSIGLRRSGQGWELVLLSDGEPTYPLPPEALTLRELAQLVDFLEEEFPDPRLLPLFKDLA